MPKSFVYTHIRGFDEEVLRGGIPQGHVILIRGASGTMKSSLAYYILYHNALGGLPGLYVTLGQTAGSLLEHVASLGLKATTVSDALPILDLSRGREHLEEMVAKVGAMTDAFAPSRSGARSSSSCPSSSSRGSGTTASSTRSVSRTSSSSAASSPSWSFGPRASR